MPLKVAWFVLLWIAGIGAVALIVHLVRLLIAHL